MPARIMYITNAEIRRVNARILDTRLNRPSPFEGLSLRILPAGSAQGAYPFYSLPAERKAATLVKFPRDTQWNGTKCVNQETVCKRQRPPMRPFTHNQARKGTGEYRIRDLAMARINLMGAESIRPAENLPHNRLWESGNRSIFNQRSVNHDFQ